MKAKASGKVDLVSIANNAIKKNPSHRNWLCDLDDDTRNQLIQIAKSLLQDGGNKTAVIAALVDAGIPITKSRMTLLLERVRKGIDQ